MNGPVILFLFEVWLSSPSLAHATNRRGVYMTRFYSRYEKPKVTWMRSHLKFETQIRYQNPLGMKLKLVYSLPIHVFIDTMQV